MALLDDFGDPLVAAFTVENTPERTAPHHYDVVLASAGGGTGVARNRDYTQALELLLRRLGALHGHLLDAAVDSRDTARKKLSLEQRRVLSPDWGIVDLYTVNDFKGLRLALTRPQKEIGAKPGSKGSNERRRLRLTVNVPAVESAEHLEQVLNHPETVEPASGTETGIDGTGVGVGDAPPPSPFRTGGPESQDDGGRSRGQGRSADSAANRAVETRAMQLAEDRYRAEGWTVDVVANTSSWDLTCRKDGAEKHVEVKGMTGTPQGIHLTANEVKHAHSCTHSALYIVHGIVLHHSDDDVTADGGTELRWDPWIIDLDRAKPTQYRYDLVGLDIDE
ncbi:DUF3883 domain-containing protein [Embleya sp. NBC_00888]|uniref:protein NO VEIN domain-containing protein n=1 Tax=Embleya sp. NBC_00888 TaxID=2975960 RepID=UPI00386AD124|nr:DUF3883 domain-containing protein [Embleya sp. NBC_00888]